MAGVVKVFPITKTDHRWWVGDEVTDTVFRKRDAVTYLGSCISSYIGLYQMASTWYLTGRVPWEGNVPASSDVSGTTFHLIYVTLWDLSQYVWTLLTAGRNTQFGQ